MGSRSFTITLSDEMAKRVKDKIDSGEYESESDIFCEGLRQLEASDFDDATLIAEIGPAYDAYLKDPCRAIPAEDVFGGLSARYQARKQARSDA